MSPSQYTRPRNTQPPSRVLPSQSMGKKRQQLIVVFFDPSTREQPAPPFFIRCGLTNFYREVVCFWAVSCEGDIIYIYILILDIL